MCRTNINLDKKKAKSLKLRRPRTKMSKKHRFIKVISAKNEMDSLKTRIQKLFKKHYEGEALVPHLPELMSPQKRTLSRNSNLEGVQTLPLVPKDQLTMSKFAENRPKSRSKSKYCV